MSITASTNSKRILKSLKKIEPKTLRGIRQAFYQVGKSLKRNADNAILRGQKTGRTYVIRRGSIRRRHRASAPGEAWANISSVKKSARGTIDYNVFGGTHMTFFAGTNSKNQAGSHAFYLEKGTRKMRRRPALENALNEEERNIEKYLGRHIIKEVKKY